MNTKFVEDIAAAVLYEGYLLYPYRASAVKNRQRWNFGVLYPRSYADRQRGSDAWRMTTECLVQSTSEVAPSVKIRFLHLVAHTIEGQSWQGAMEREILLPPRRLSELASEPVRQKFEFPPVENQQLMEAIVETEAEQLKPGVFKMSVCIFNSVAFAGSTRDEALMQSLVSTHTILGIEDGEFVSLLDPPDNLRDLTAKCENAGTWPVLAGEEGQRAFMLSSPIILYDYPKIAPESPGALFDGTEIDESLTLRIMTLSD
jgi:hypothetical protein